MMIKNIELALREMLQGIVLEFPELYAKYEFQERWHSYVVSYYYKGEAPYAFYERALQKENEMRSRFGDDAPLFCDNEDGYVLSEDAITIAAQDSLAYKETKNRKAWLPEFYSYSSNLAA